jgi:mono/diheme cytochrome c family protein
MKGTGISIGHWRKMRVVAAGSAALVGVGLQAGATLGQESAAGRTTVSGVYSTEQAERGQAIFATRCAACHGPDLGGGDLAPPLHGEEFLSAWTGRPLRRLYSRIISTMPPDDVGSLSEDETVALVALVLKTNGYPVGTQPAGRADDLNAITVVAPEGAR